MSDIAKLAGISKSKVSRALKEKLKEKHILLPADLIIKKSS